ncbi:hypothetical protein V9T40_010846 [Parthenolecanium corni]|uniref:Homeobox domain-containing protein n=1 Tax=Parthenolecanium corni TaxID=536013 RepID=A0AAN9XYZ5_9HEMI
MLTFDFHSDVFLCADSLGSSKQQYTKRGYAARSHGTSNLKTWYSPDNASMRSFRTKKVKVEPSTLPVLPPCRAHSNLPSDNIREATNETELNQSSMEGLPSHSDVGIPDTFEGKIGRRSSAFFYGLPYAKRFILLKRTEDMTTTSTELGLNLAEELDLPVRSVSSWLSRRRCKNKRIGQNPFLTPDKMAVLQKWFQYSKELSEELALLLSYELELPVKVIYDCFEKMRMTYSQPEPVCCISDEEADLPSAEVTLNEVPVSSDDEGSCSPIGTHMDVSDDENDRFVFSDKVAARTVKYRNKFFYMLPYSKQIALLKKSRYLTINQTNLAKKLARRLNLPYDNLFGRLSRRRYRNLRLLQISKLTDEQEILLQDEFQLSQELSEERALMLSYELVLPVDKIQEWFEFKKNSLETKSL